jgi:hypothetical protein
MKQLIKEYTIGRTFPTKTRIKIGKAITTWALLPFNASIWMLPVGLAMSMALSPSVFAKKKIIEFKEAWRLR